MTFTGFARSRNRIQSSLPQTREQRQIQAGTDQFFKDIELRQAIEKESATQALDYLRTKFKADQDFRQNLYDLQSEQARFRRDQADAIYQNEVKRAELADADKNALLESISGISKTASDYLLKQAETKKQNEINFGRGLATKYGLTPDEVADLSEAEYGLNQYRLNDVAVVQRLRDAGASETELEQLISLSGWAKEGAVRIAVQNAGSDYSGYLSANSDTPFLINGREVSLVEAESEQSLELQSAVLDRLRGDFIDEYLPNVKPEYIVQYAKNSFQIAEGQRQTTVSDEVEKSAKISNQIAERTAFMANVRENAQNNSSLGMAAALRSELLDLSKDGTLETVPGRLLQRYAGFIALGVESKEIEISDAESFLLLGNFGQNFAEYAKPIREAIEYRYDDLQKGVNRQESKELAVYKQVTGKVEAEFRQRIEDDLPITDKDFQLYVDEMERQGVGVYRIQQGLAELDKYRRYDSTYLNDQEFKENNPDLYAGRPNSVTIADIAAANLSPAEYRKAVSLVESIEYPTVPENLLSQKRREYKNRLAQLLFDGEKRPGEISSTLEPATDAIMRIWENTYTTEYKKDGDSNRAASVADANVADTIVKGETTNTGLLRRKIKRGVGDGTDILDREYENFKLNPKLPVVTPDLNDLTKKIRRDPTVINREQLIPSQVLKEYAFLSQTNPGVRLPVQAITMYKASGIPHMDIIKAQLDFLRQSDPSIPEIPYEITVRQRAAVEDATGIDYEAFTRNIRYIPTDAEMLLDRRNRYSGRQTLFSSRFARDNPASSTIDFFKNLKGDKTGARVEMSDNEIITFLAIMYGESGSSGFDNAQRITDVEKSFGRFQINTKVHGDLLRSMGLSANDMFDPYSNMKMALALYRRRIEAKQNGFLDWGAYTNGSYQDHLERARQDLESWKVRPTRYQNPDNYRDDVSDGDRDILGVAPSGMSIGSNTGVQITARRDSDANQPGTDFVIEDGRRGAKFFWPYSSEVVRVTRNASANYIKGSGQSGYGNYVDILTTMPSGNRTQVRIAHFDSVNPQIQTGMTLPPGTFLGTQGTTGSTNGAPHISADFYHESEYYTHNEAARREFLSEYLDPLNLK